MAASAWRPITIMANLSADLRQRMREYAHQLGLPAFWRWWTAQLAPLVPASPRAALKRRLLRPVLAFAPDVAVLWVPRTTNGTLSYAASARIPLAGDPAVVQQAGRAVIDALPKISYGVGPPVAKVVVALPVGSSAAQGTAPADGRRAGLETGARLRSRPPHAVQARRAPLRRRGRRSRCAKRRDTRRLGGGAAQRGDGSAPPRGELGSDGGRRHARIRLETTARRRRGARASTCCRRPTAPRLRGGAAGGCGCRSRWSRSCF